MSQRSKSIKLTSVVGIIGNGILAILKITFGIISGSIAVIADGIDSASDIVGSVITYYVSSASELPPDKEHPWGHERMETLASKVISIFILFAGIELVISTVEELFSGKTRSLPGKSAFVVTVISILCKGFIAYYKFKVAKKYNSSMVRNDAINMKNDIYLSATVLIGLAVTYLTNIPLVDSFLGLCLGFWIIWTGAKLSLENNEELMDSFDDQATIYKDIFSIVNKTKGAFNPHKMRIRKINNNFDISMDVEVDPLLTVKQGHDIARQIDCNIRNKYINIYDILIHIEPKGSYEDEQYGLNQKDFD